MEWHEVPHFPGVIDALDRATLCTLRSCNEEFLHTAAQRLCDLQLLAFERCCTAQDRRRALSALKMMNCGTCQGDAALVTRCCEILLDPREHRIVRTEAVRVLQEVKTSQAELVGKALHSAVDTETDRFVRRALVDATGHFAHESPLAMEALFYLSKDQDRFVAAAAATILEQGLLSDASPTDFTAEVEKGSRGWHFSMSPFLMAIHGPDQCRFNTVEGNTMATQFTSDSRIRQNSDSSDSSTSSWVRMLNESIGAEEISEDDTAQVSFQKEPEIESEGTSEPKTSQPLHVPGICEPCLFFWSRRWRCAKGDRCEYCHHHDFPPVGKTRPTKAVREKIQRRLYPLLQCLDAYDPSVGLVEKA
eukprot:symbB.v1.2.001142.t1/scaffold62.1/size503095/8